jgi:hypothetical protein
VARYDINDPWGSSDDADDKQSLRGDIMLFLLVQITIASPGHGQNVGTSNP